MDETSIKINGVQKYLYRAMGKKDKTIDFLPTRPARQGCSELSFVDQFEKLVLVPNNTTFISG